MTTNGMSGLAGLASPSIPRRGLDRWLGALLRRAFGDAPLRFELRDGAVLLAPAKRHVATVLLADRRALLPLLWDPEGCFGDAYATGRIEIDGELVAAVRLSPPPSRFVKRSRTLCCRA